MEEGGREREREKEEVGDTCVSTNWKIKTNVRSPFVLVVARYCFTPLWKQPSAAANQGLYLGASRRGIRANLSLNISNPVNVPRHDARRYEPSSLRRLRATCPLAGDKRDDATMVENEGNVTLLDFLSSPVSDETLLEILHSLYCNKLNFTSRVYL